MGWVGGLGVIIESNLNRVRLSCCWVGVGLGCDKSSSVEGFELFPYAAMRYIKHHQNSITFCRCVINSMTTELNCDLHDQ